jgi:hypothetical protein
MVQVLNLEELHALIMFTVLIRRLNLYSLFSAIKV